MSDKKVTYKLSPSLLNSWLFYESNRSEKNFKSFVSSLKGEFKGNKWTRRGTKYEQEVFDGEHGNLSVLLEDLPKQVWSNRVITVDGVQIKISGKLDVIDKEKKCIYDIKRSNSFYEKKYDTSMQHILYFFLNPEMEDFYYLVTTKNENEQLETNIIHKKRPSKENLELCVYGIIRKFFKFLKENGLWEIYLDKQKAKARYRSE